MTRVVAGGVARQGRRRSAGWPVMLAPSRPPTSPTTTASPPATTPGPWATPPSHGSSPTADAQCGRQGATDRAAAGDHGDRHAAMRGTGSRSVAGSDPASLGGPTRLPSSGQSHITVAVTPERSRSLRAWSPPSRWDGVRRSPWLRADASRVVTPVARPGRFSQAHLFTHSSWQSPDFDTRAVHDGVAGLRRRL